MARIPRLTLDNGLYHVIQRGNDRKQVFQERSDYQYFYRLLKKYLKIYPSFLYHYCLMPNHLHLLLQVIEAGNLSKLMQGINLSYTLYYKNKYGFVGSLWQGRYKSIVIEKDEYLMECGRYIARNPLRAGLVKKPEEYEFSSYKFYSNGSPSDIITEDVLYHDFGTNARERQSIYREYVLQERAHDKILDEILRL